MTAIRATSDKKIGGMILLIKILSEKNLKNNPNTKAINKLLEGPAIATFKEPYFSVSYTHLTLPTKRIV